MVPVPPLLHQLLATLNAGSRCWMMVASRYRRLLGSFRHYDHGYSIVHRRACDILAAGLLSSGARGAASRSLAVARLCLCLRLPSLSGSGISLTPVCIGQLCEIEECGRELWLIDGSAPCGRADEESWLGVLGCA